MANGFFDDEYLEKLRRRFTRKLNHDTIAQKYQWQILNGTATFEEAEKYAARAGEILADVLQDGITKDILPDGVLTEETAEKILGTMLREDHELVTEASAKVMEDLNRAAGMQMNAIRPPVETDRITGLAEKAASYADLEDALWLFRDPVINFSQHTTDRLIEENVDAHYKAGLSPRITRKAVGGCCKWCSSLSGKYDYPVDREVYRRHENCRCLVLYDPGDGKVQNAHTKKQYDSATDAERDSRIERAKELEQQQEKKEALKREQRIRRGKMPDVDLKEYGLEFVPGTRPFYPKDTIMAGKGCKTGREIDDIDRLVREYAEFNADAANWSKRKARYQVYDEYGEIREIEIHYYQHPNVGKCEDKIKFDEYGNYFIDLWVIR